MTASLASPAERARKIVTVVLQRVKAAETQAALAVVIGSSEPTVNRLLNEHTTHERVMQKAPHLIWERDDA
jgi:hypothetical protein